MSIEPENESLFEEPPATPVVPDMRDVAYAPQPAQIADRREAFESWMLERNYHIARDADGEYVYYKTHEFWLIWQAGAAFATPPNHAACEVERKAEKCWRQPCADTGRCEAPSPIQAHSNVAPAATVQQTSETVQPSSYPFLRCGCGATWPCATHHPPAPARYILDAAQLSATVQRQVSDALEIVDEAQCDPGRSAEYRHGYIDAFNEVRAALRASSADNQGDSNG